MKLPDSPKTPPWLQKIQYITNPLGYMDNAYQRYGDIFNAPIIGNHSRVLLVSDPEGLQQLFTRDSKEFYTPSNGVLQMLVGDNSIFCLEGNRHKRERKLLMPPFHGDRMRGYGQTICDLTEEIFSQLTPGTNFSARSVVQNISIEVILKVVFGIHEGERFHKLKQLMVEWMDSFASPLVSSLLFFPFLRKDFGAKSPWGYFRRLQQQIDQLIYAEIRDKRSKYNPSDTDILTLLMSARDEHGEGMSDEELHDELITLLVAGHETTATAISWALYWVHKQPVILEKLLRELDSLGDSPEPMNIFKLPYLTAVCNETLRIYPVAMLTVPREVKEPVELMGYQLEPGTRVYGCIYLTHRREDLYPQPKEFKPERFLDRQYTPYEFFPFGGGARRCIGEALAIFEMKLVLATILGNYQLELVDNLPVKPQRRGVTIAPAGGVNMVLKERRQNQLFAESTSIST
ncbi:MAG: cytochrome P450 [Calothrix sp. MO_192.B10]|nr:cytochrome P450 [Calothrix sp. MO_192.B10]